MKSILLTSVLACSGLALALRSPAEAASTAGAGAPAELVTYEIDGVHSSVLFATRHAGISRFYGRFNEVSGKVGFDPAEPGAGFIEVEIPAASVDSANEGRDEHLRGPDFLSVKEYPVIGFVSSSVEGTAEALTVKGELTLHGVTREVEAAVEKVGEGTFRGSDRVGFEARFTIDMGDFGLDFVKQNPGALGPEVELIVSLECKR